MKRRYVCLCLSVSSIQSHWPWASLLLAEGWDLGANEKTPSASSEHLVLLREFFVSAQKTHMRTHTHTVSRIQDPLTLKTLGLCSIQTSLQNINKHSGTHGEVNNLLCLIFCVCVFQPSVLIICLLLNVSLLCLSVTVLCLSAHLLGHLSLFLKGSQRTYVS